MRRAIDGGEYQPLAEYLERPDAPSPSSQGDVSAVAKALRDFARANPHLVIKGGLADGSLLSSADLAALADLPPREVLLARLAGALAAPMQQLAGLLQALPRNLAYGLSALIEQQGGGDEAAAAAPTRPRRPRPQPADDADRRGRRSRGRRGRAAGTEAAAPEAPEAAEAAAARGAEAGGQPPRRRPDRRAGRRVAADPSPNRPQDRPHHKTEGKKGRPGRWQP